MFWERFYDLCIRFDTKPNPVGEIIGISSGVITKWKKGAIPNGEMLIKVADHFNCSVDYLLGRSNNEHVRTFASTSPLDEREQNLIEHFRALDMDGKARVEGLAVNEHDRIKLKRDRAKPTAG